MEVANALAYYVTVTITAAKSFFVQAPVVSNLYTISVVASMRLQKIYCSIKLIFFFLSVSSSSAHSWWQSYKTLCAV